MKTKISTKITALRKQRGLSQEELCKEMDVSRSLVASWENGDRTIRSDDLVKLAHYFHVSADYLLGLVGEDNTTDDEKLRIVSEYTGLSNEAIGALHSLLTPDSNGVYAAGFTDADCFTPNKLLSEFFVSEGMFFFSALVDISDAINMLQNIDKEPALKEVNKASDHLKEFGIAAISSFELSTLKADAASTRFSSILHDIYQPFFFEAWSKRKTSMPESDHEN